VFVVGLEQRHCQPEQLTEHRQLVVLRGRVAEQLEVLLRGRAIVGLAAADTGTTTIGAGTASATVVLDGHVGRGPRRRGLRIRNGPPRIMGNGITGAPEMRRLVEARGRRAAVDRSPLRYRPLQFASSGNTAAATATAAFHYRVRIFVVQVRGGLENVSGHVQRPEVRFQRVDGRLQGQQQLSHVTL